MEKQGKQSVKLKIQRASIKDLALLMPVNTSGRFMELKAQAFREIIETPPDQFVIIRASSEMLTNPKECKAALHALTSFIQKKSDWLVRWSMPAKGFLLVRRDQYKKQKKGDSK